MYPKDAIRFSLNLAEQAMFKSLANIDDIPLTFPTQEGGCHPLWVLGHLAFVEGLAYEMLAGGENPCAEWASLFAPDSIPTPKARWVTLGPTCAGDESAISRFAQRCRPGYADPVAA